MILMLDIDGVVVDGRPSDGRPWWTDLEADLGIPKAALREAFFQPHWQAIVTGAKPLRPTLDAALAGLEGAPSAEALVAYWHKNDARLVPEALALCARARAAGHVVGFATNQDAARAAYLWDTLGLRVHAEHLHSSAELGVAKPDPAFFQAIAQRHGTAPEGFVFADDSPANVAAAQGLGWQAVQISAPSDLDQVADLLGLAA